MATKKKVAKKVAKPIKKVSTPTKAKAKPAKKAIVKPTKKSDLKLKPTNNKATKTASKPQAKPAVKPSAKAALPAKKAAKTAKAPKNKTKSEAPARKSKNTGPETVANVSFRKSESFSSRAAAAAKQNIKPNNDNRTRYSDKELNEFRALIDEKLAAARNELKYLQDQINRKDDNGTDDTENKFANMEDGTMTQEREYLTQMASRQVQYIENLEKALVRIQNKTYGICRVTGKLIDKERLRIVPHATLSMEAKMMQK